MRTTLPFLFVLLSYHFQVVTGGYNKGPAVGGNPALGHTSATNCHVFSGTSVTCAITVTNGNQLAFIGLASAGGQAVSGTAGICDGTWTLDTPNNTIFSATSKATGSGTCTVTLTGTSGTLDLMGVEIKNTSGIDVRGTLVGGGFHSANTSINCPAVTTTASNDLVVCGYEDHDNNGCVPTAGSGFTIAVTSTAPPSGWEDGTQASAGSITPTFSCSTGATPTIQTIAYKP